jgi:outer membrane receptor protein involved in Fe transport
VLPESIPLPLRQFHFTDESKLRFILPVCFFVLGTLSAISQIPGSTEKKGNPAAKDSIITPFDTLIFKLDEVIISAPAAVREKQLDPSKIAESGASNVIQALDKIPGIFKVHEHSYALVVRGVYGSRVRIERNGINREALMDEGYLMQDVNPGQVGEIELIQGAESIIYGSGSMGGIVRIEDLGVFNDHRNTIFLGWSSNNNERSTGINQSYRKKNFGLLYSGRLLESDNIHFPGDSAALNSEVWSVNHSLSIGCKLPRNKGSLEWRNSFSRGLWERPQGFQNQPLEFRNLRDALNISSDLLWTIKLDEKKSLKSRFWYMHQDSYQDKRNYNPFFTQINFFESRNYILGNTGIRCEYLQKWSTSQLRGGIDLAYMTYNEIWAEEDYLLGRFNPESFTQFREDLRMGIFGLFERSAEKYSWKITARGDQAHVRSDSLNTLWPALTGGAEITWKPTDGIRNTFSISRHFRYPETKESVGIVFGGRGVFSGNPNIRPEHSTNAEWGFRFRQGPFHIYLNGWFSWYDSRISEYLVEEGQYSYFNSERARIVGLEAGIEYRKLFLERYILVAVANTSLIQGDKLTINQGIFQAGEALIGIAPGRFRESIEIGRHGEDGWKFSAGINADHVLALSRLPKDYVPGIIGTNEADAYFLFGANLSATKNLGKRTIGANITFQNLLDTVYFPFGAYIPGMGRNMRIGLRILY